MPFHHLHIDVQCRVVWNEEKNDNKLTENAISITSRAFHFTFICEVIKIKWQNELLLLESTKNFQQSTRNERVQRWKMGENYVPK